MAHDRIELLGAALTAVVVLSVARVVVRAGAAPSTIEDTRSPRFVERLVSCVDGAASTRMALYRRVDREVLPLEKKPEPTVICLPKRDAAMRQYWIDMVCVNWDLIAICMFWWCYDHGSFEWIEFFCSFARLLMELRRFYATLRFSIF